MIKCGFIKKRIGVVLVSVFVATAACSVHLKADGTSVSAKASLDRDVDDLSDKKKDLQSLLTIISQAISHSKLKDISYDSQEIALPVPQTGLEVVLDLKCKGSGNLFKPLPTPRVYTRKKQNDAAESNELSNFFIGLGESVLKDKAAEHVDEIPLIKALSYFETEETLFLVKLVLLSLTSASKEQSDASSAYFYNELFRLLCRLSTTKITESSLSKKRLSSYLPAIVQAWINAKDADVLSLVDDVWAALFIEDEKIETLVKTTGPLGLNMFAFNDKDLAHKVHQHCVKKQPADFVGSVQNVVEQHDTLNKYSIHPYRDVKNLHDNQAPFCFLIGQKTCALDQCDQDIIDVLPNLKAAVQNDAKSHGIIQLEDIHGRSWVVQVAKRLSILETFKISLITLIKTFKKYQKMRADDQTEAIVVSTNVKGFGNGPANVTSLQERIDELALEIQEHEALLNKGAKSKAFAANLQKQINDEKKELVQLKKRIQWEHAENMLGTIMTLNPEFKLLFEDMAYNPTYAPLKTDVIKMLSYIMQRSDFIQKNKHTTSHVVSSLVQHLGLPEAWKSSLDLILGISK